MPVRDRGNELMARLWFVIEPATTGAILSVRRYDTSHNEDMLELHACHDMTEAVNRLRTALEKYGHIGTVVPWPQADQPRESETGAEPAARSPQDDGACGSDMPADAVHPLAPLSVSDPAHDEPAPDEPAQQKSPQPDQPKPASRSAEPAPKPARRKAVQVSQAENLDDASVIGLLREIGNRIQSSSFTIDAARLSAKLANIPPLRVRKSIERLAEAGSLSAARQRDGSYIVNLEPGQ